MTRWGSMDGTSSSLPFGISPSYLYYYSFSSPLLSTIGLYISTFLYRFPLCYFSFCSSKSYHHDAQFMMFVLSSFSIVIVLHLNLLIESWFICYMLETLDSNMCLKLDVDIVIVGRTVSYTRMVNSFIYGFPSLLCEVYLQPSQLQIIIYKVPMGPQVCIYIYIMAVCLILIEK